jgi:hypothetical protein
MAIPNVGNIIFTFKRKIFTGNEREKSLSLLGDSKKKRK